MPEGVLIVRIRDLILTAMAITALAVPGLSSTAGAAPMNGGSARAGKVIVPDAEKGISPRAACGTEECGANGVIEWGPTYLKIYGIVWGTPTNEGYVEVEWTSGGVTIRKEPASAPGRAGVNFNKYYKTSEPGYILVRVCGSPIGVCGSWEDP